MNQPEKDPFTIGELAGKAGVSVRTLQYYDRTGLLKAKLSESGRRVYTKEDVFLLQQILFYKSFGFSLEEIENQLLKAGSVSDLEKIFTRQREILAGQIENLNRMVRMLDTLIFEAGRGEEIGLEKLTAMMELMRQGNPYAFVLRYFGTEQFRGIARRYEDENKQEESREFMRKAGGLFVEMNALYQTGADPAGAEGQKLAQRWWEMVMEFTGGDPGLLRTLVSAGMDMDNWPEETREFKAAIGNFLGAALSIFLKGKGIRLSGQEEGLQ